MIYLIQVAFILFGFLSAIEEEAFTWPFRNVPFENKEALTKKFHRAGGAAVLSMMILAASPSFFLFHELSPQVLHFLAYFALAGTWYWNIFDITYALRMGGQKWHYVGTTSEIDKLLRKLFGENAGKIRTALGVVLIILLNILN